MKAARLVVLGVALAAGGVAAYLASSHHEAPPPAAPPPPPLATVEILIAKNDLGRGQLIGEGDIGWQIWPQAAATQSFVKKAERPDAMRQFVGAIVRIVRVLAIDQAVEEKAGQKVVVGKTATLELNPDQAETLTLSRQLGTLSLALRSLVDSQSSTVEGGDDDDQRGPMNTVRYGVSTLSLSH